MKRREFLKLALMTASLLPLVRYTRVSEALADENAIEKLTLSDDEWRKRLSSEQYDILRHQGTERAFTSPLVDEHREGIFACAGCGLELFPSKFKFDSGTGWPSFFDAFPGHLATKKDYLLVAPRTEYHCARCGGHHGHVFEDGPKPTGLRYCNNGAVLTFLPAKTS